MKVMLRAVDSLLRSKVGGQVYGSDFDIQLAQLKRELK